MAVRFAAAYLFLYIFPFPLPYIPFVYSLCRKYIQIWHGIVPWFGRHILQLNSDITKVSPGISDTAYDYVRLPCLLALAAAVTVIWSFVDRNRVGCEKSFQWLRVYFRFSLAGMMISYGAVKVFNTQFPPPALHRLLQPFGDATPMALLWTFMGASEIYTVFTGLAEMFGGILLASRRTTMLGALICIGVLSHVVVLNFCYDVPVKLLSSHLLAVAVFLIGPDLKRLSILFLFNGKVEPIEIRPLFAGMWLNRTGFVVRTAFVGFLVISSLLASYKGRQWRVSFKSPLDGIWSVEEFEVDGEMRPMLLSERSRWRRVIFDGSWRSAIQMMDTSLERFQLNLELEKKRLTLQKLDDREWKSQFSFEQPEVGVTIMQGSWEGHSIRAKLRRTEQPEFPLTNWKFHWIDAPGNR